MVPVNSLETRKLPSRTRFLGRGPDFRDEVVRPLRPGYCSVRAEQLQACSNVLCAFALVLISPLGESQVGKEARREADEWKKLTEDPLGVAVIFPGGRSVHRRGKTRQNN